MIEDKEMEYVNVPTYIEKAVKKLFKLKNTEKELAMQIKDYMSTHDIPLETPLQLLKYIPKENVDENQMKINFETGKVEQKGKNINEKLELLYFNTPIEAQRLCYEINSVYGDDFIVKEVNVDEE